MARNISTLLLWLSALTTPFVLAEGAVRELACEINKDCDASGVCQVTSGDITFRMEPVIVSDDSSGTYQIHYDNNEAAMQALSFAGPFHWQSDSEMNTLLASSETHFLWHHLDLRPEPAANIRYMTCQFTQ